MNKETFEALKYVVRLAYESGIQNGDSIAEKAIEMVEEWIEEKQCWDCEHGKHLSGKCQKHEQI
jgi:hypothetical protein